MYNPLQFQQLLTQETELHRRLQHRTPWPQPESTGTTTARRRWWPRPRRQVRFATSSS